MVELKKGVGDTQKEKHRGNGQFACGECSDKAKIEG